MSDAANRQAAAVALGRAVVQLARTAVARLLLRDHDEGFLALSERERATMLPRAALFGAHLETVAASWGTAERADPDGPLSTLGRLAGGMEELLLLLLAAAPKLERTVARTYRSLEPDGLTVGLLLDLVGADEPGRLALARTLAADAPLRRHGLLITPNPTAVSTDPVTVPASIIAALRGERIAAPPVVDRAQSALDRGTAAADLDKLGVRPLRAGELRLLTGGTADALALAERLGASEGCPLWMLPIDARPAAAGQTGAWTPLLRDARLAGALVVIDLADEDPAVAGALASAAAQLSWPCVALGSPSTPPAPRDQSEIQGK